MPIACIYYIYLNVLRGKKIAVEQLNLQIHFVEFAGFILGGQQTARSVMLLGLIDILFSCTLDLLTSGAPR